MDLFWHVRQLFPYPRLFGLIDDLSTLLLKEYLGLHCNDAVATCPEKAVLLMKLRLINRENYFYCQRHGFPLLTALVAPSTYSTKGGKPFTITDTRPWYDKRVFVNHAIQNNMCFAIFRQPGFWHMFGKHAIIDFATNAIETHNITVLRSVLPVAAVKATVSKRLLWRRHAIDTDFADAYVLLTGKRMKKITDAGLLEILAADADACFRAVALAHASRRVAAAQNHFLLRANLLLRSVSPPQQANIVLIRATLVEMLSSLWPSTTKTRAPKRKRADADATETPPAKRARTEGEAGV